MKKTQRAIANALLFVVAFSSIAMFPAAVATNLPTSGTIQLGPEAYAQSIVDLQKGDRFEGNFTVTDLLPYEVKNPLAIMQNYSGIHTFGVEVFASDPVTHQRIFYFGGLTANSRYFFNYTAEYPGTYFITFYCTMNVFGPDVKIPKVNFNYNVVEAMPLEIKILSPLNQSYVESSLPLSFAINREVNVVSYSLDGKDNVTLNDNTTLTGLFDGMHHIIVYANDTFGYVDAQVVTFTVASSTLAPSPSPTVPEFPSWVILPILAITTLAVFTGIRKKLRPKN